MPAPGEFAEGYPLLEPVFAAAAPSMIDALQAIETHRRTLLALVDATPPAPRFRQDWFPRLDAAAAYAIVRRHRPRHLVEIGAGHSTRWFARAVADAAAGTRLRCIDPEPRAVLGGLAVEHLRARAENAGDDAYADLGAGDVLSLDGSHVLTTGGDVDHVFNRVLPGAPAGLLVHVHDVFLPDGYPRAWAARGYTEQSLVAALLQGGGFRLLWSSHWVATRMRDAIDRGVVARLPLPDGAYESSVWLEKRDLRSTAAAVRRDPHA